MSRPRNFSRRASIDLDEAVGWLLDHGGSVKRAGNLLREVQTAGARLAERPSLEHRRPALLPDPYRFWSLPRHRLLLVYDPSTAPPKILRVLSTSQDLDGLFADLWEAREADDPS